MTRVLSALVLLPVVIGAVWFLPPVATLVLALVAAALSFFEYVTIVQALGARVPIAVTGAAVVASCAAVGGGYIPVEVILMSAVITLGALAVASGQPGPAVLRDTAASVLPVVYIGLPLGALAAIRLLGGREAVLLLMITLVVSDSAQVPTQAARLGAVRWRPQSARRRPSRVRLAVLSSEPLPCSRAGHGFFPPRTRSCLPS